MMFASGVGANGNRALGVGSIGGMLIGMILQLLVVPALFVAFQLIQEKVTPDEVEGHRQRRYRKRNRTVFTLIVTNTT